MKGGLVLNARNEKYDMTLPVKTSKQAFLSELSTRLKIHSGEGWRLIIFHAENDDGFVPKACEIFQAHKYTKS